MTNTMQKKLDVAYRHLYFATKNLQEASIIAAGSERSKDCNPLSSLTDRVDDLVKVMRRHWTS